MIVIFIVNYGHKWDGMEMIEEAMVVEVEFGVSGLWSNSNEELRKLH